MNVKLGQVFGAIYMCWKHLNRTPFSSKVTTLNNTNGLCYILFDRNSSINYCYKINNVINLITVIYKKAPTNTIQCT